VIVKYFITFCLLFCFSASGMHMEIGGDPYDKQHTPGIAENLSPYQQERHFQGKALCLVSPHPHLQEGPYVGLGIGTPQSTTGKTLPTVEGVLGYTPFSEDRIKIFTQLKASKPQDKDPAVQASIGLRY